MTNSKETNGYLTKKMFYWILSILIGLVVSVLAYQTGKIDKLGITYNHNVTDITADVSDIKVNIKGLQTDMEWLKKELTK